MNQSQPASSFVVGPRLFVYVLLLTPIALLPTSWTLELMLLSNACLFGLAIWEGRNLKRRLPKIERTLPARVLVGEEGTVKLTLRAERNNRYSKGLYLTVADDCPRALETEESTQRLLLSPGERTTVEYSFRPLKRGECHFRGIAARLDGRLGLASLRVWFELPATLRVYPNIQKTHGSELTAALTQRGGERSTRRRRGDGEFELLRDYVPGDAYRHVDWKSTAKRSRPVTRVFQQESDQQVLLAIDRGRMMGLAAPSTTLADTGARTHLDHAVHAALVLAFLALKRGDRVGLIVCGSTVSKYLAPKGGGAQYQRILNALFDAEPSEADFDMRELASCVAARVKRRALLVLMGDLGAALENNQEAMQSQLAILNRKHLLLCLTPTDWETKALSERRLNAPTEVFKRIAAADRLEETALLRATLSQKGIDVLEANGGAQAGVVVERYLDIKARGLL